jgi:hypothetical protein
VPFVSLTLSSLALCTMAFLKNGRKRVSESKEGRKGNHKKCLPGLGGDSVGDLTAVNSVVHEQQFDVLLVSKE